MTRSHPASVSVALVSKLGVRRVDIAVAALAAVVGQQEVWAPLRAGFSHPRVAVGAVAVSYLLASAALLWRRRAPLTVVAIVAVVLSADYLLFGAPDGLGNLLPPVFALYAAGRYGAPSRFPAAMALTAALVGVHEWRDPQFVLNGSTLTFWSILLGSGVLGRVFNIQARHLQALSRHTVRLEREREERASAVAAERARITGELHDLVGHGLSLMVLQVVAAQGSLEQGRLQATRRQLERLETTTRTTLAEMRRLVSLGHDTATLAPQPGIADISSLLDELRGSGVAVELDVVGGPIDAPGGVGLAVYRLVQEAMTNVIKHARPSAGARVVLANEGHALRVEVLDCGREPVGDLNGGRGLAGMRERVALYGGTLQVGPRAEGGFGVRASFPLGEMPA